MVWMPYIAVLLWLLSFLVEIWLEPTTLWFNTEHPPNCTMDSCLRYGIIKEGPLFINLKQVMAIQASSGLNSIDGFGFLIWN